MKFKSVLYLISLLASLPAAHAELQSEPFTNSLGMKFVPIPAGNFLMGSPKKEKGRGRDENQVSVTLTSPFFMAEAETTQGQWISLTGKSIKEQIETQDGPQNRGAKLVKEVSAIGDNQPMTFVSWADAVSFCKALTEKEREAGTLPEGFKYSLPTEAQWEYACRAGTTTVFYFGDKLTSKEANFYGKLPYGTKVEGDYLEKTAEVKSYAPNAWNLYDTHGNVYEWCLDFYGEALPGGEDPRGVEDGDSRIIRGGTWNRKALSARSAYRYSTYDYVRSYNIGFRVALVPDR